MPGINLKQQLEQAKVEDQPRDIPINGLDGKPMTHMVGDKKTPVTISVVGIHSQAYRAVEAEQRQRRLRPRQMTSETFFEDAIEKAVACTKGWDGFYEDEEGTVPLRCDPHNVRMMYKMLDWLYEQVVEAMNDHALFSQSSSS